MGLKNSFLKICYSIFILTNTYKMTIGYIHLPPYNISTCLYNTQCLHETKHIYLTQYRVSYGKTYPKSFLLAFEI